MSDIEEDKCKVCKQPALFICFKCEKWYCEDHWRKDHCKYVKDNYTIEITNSNDINVDEAVNIVTQEENKRIIKEVTKTCEKMKEIDKQIVEEFKQTETNPEQQ